MPTSLELRIAALEARKRELIDARNAEVVNTEGLPPDGPERLDAAADRLLQLLPTDEEAFMLEFRRRAALSKALEAEYRKADEELAFLRWQASLPQTKEEFDRIRALAEQSEAGTPSKRLSFSELLVCTAAAGASVWLSFFAIGLPITLATKALHRDCSTVQTACPSGDIWRASADEAAYGATFVSLVLAGPLLIGACGKSGRKDSNQIPGS